MPFYEVKKTHQSNIGRGSLSQKVARNTFSWHRHRSWERLFVVYSKDIYVHCYHVPKRNYCQIPRKRVTCDYLLLKFITAKTFEILNSTITKMTYIIRKSKYNIFKQFFYFLNRIRVTRCSKHPFFS